MDEQVARPKDPEVLDLLRKFVCVRCVQAFGIDLTRFRFDNGQSWCAFILNANDGTVYGRYGSRSAPDASLHNSMEGFKKGLRAALGLHEQYPKCKPSLDGKKAYDCRWRFPEVLPENQGKFRKLESDRRGCLCCHWVQSGEIMSYRSLGIPMDDSQFWVFPMPDPLGFTLDPAEIAVVRTVAAGSEAEEAGIKPGDRILAMKGQPLISIADVQWVLHTAQDPCKVPVKVEREGKTLDLSLSLPKNWRQRGDFAWRRATMPLRNRVLGFACEVLPDAERGALNLAADALALRVRDVTGPQVQGGNQEARKAGLQKGDVIVEVDGRKTAMTESDLIAYVFLKRPPGTKLALGVLQGGVRRNLAVTMK
jgi:serine protease Do